MAGKRVALLTTSFARLGEIRDVLQPDPFCGGAPEGEKRYLRQEAQRISREVSDEATRFLEARGFGRGGLKKK